MRKEETNMARDETREPNSPEFAPAVALLSQVTVRLDWRTESSAAYASAAGPPRRYRRMVLRASPSSKYWSGSIRRR